MVSKTVLHSLFTGHPENSRGALPFDRSPVVSQSSGPRGKCKERPPLIDAYRTVSADAALYFFPHIFQVTIQFLCFN